MADLTCRCAARHPVFAPAPAKVLELLSLSYESALRAEINPWQHALPWPVLRAASGITPKEIRYLVKQSLLQHQVEISTSPESPRQFRKPGRGEPTASSCYVATKPGVQMAQVLANCRLHGQNKVQIRRRTLRREIASRKPAWDAKERELHVGSTLVKRFKRAAKNQELILCVFEEEGWPEWIDDPLPAVKGIEPRQRLKEAVKSLNRQHHKHLLNFSGDFVRGRIQWNLSPPASPPEEIL